MGTAAPENRSAWNTANKPWGATGPPKNIGSLKGLKRSLGNISASERSVGRLMMTPVVSAPSSWVTSTTVSRKLGSGIPGLAMRKTVLDGPCAYAAVAKARSARSAARHDSFIRRSFAGRALILRERGDPAQAPGGPGGYRPGSPKQLLPESRRILAEDELGVGLEHVPHPPVDLLAQLARPPGDIADVVARFVGRLFDDVVYDCALSREEQLFQDLDRSGAGRVIDVDHRENRLAQHRPAEVHRIAHQLGGACSGKRLASERPVGRLMMTPTCRLLSTGTASSTAP